MIAKDATCTAFYRVHFSVLVLFFILAIASGRKIGERCQPSTNENGICSDFEQCHDVIFPQFEKEKVCFWQDSNPIVCCSNPKINATKEIEVPNKRACIHIHCGYIDDLPVHTIILEDRKTYDVYELNRTADLLESQGFNITVELTFGDVLRKFSYTNGTFVGTREFLSIAGISPVGGKPAIKQRSYYTVLLGQRTKDEIMWWCDGILINDQWVLSAAHCFHSTVELDVVRLGERDWKKPILDTFDIHVDLDIEKIVVHPLYKITSGYHDLVLIKLSKIIGELRNNIAPICLPWGEETNRKHVNSILTLSGWGATSFRSAGGSKTNILTEVDLKVFNTTKCDQSYSSLLDYPNKWSHGMNENYILCAGSDEGGKDACKGDSGAPLVYQREDSRIVLAGVVSAGFGCGLKDFPGLYIPINNPFYLQWIKDVAFDDCSKL